MGVNGCPAFGFINFLACMSRLTALYIIPFYCLIWVYSLDFMKKLFVFFFQPNDDNGAHGQTSEQEPRVAS